MPSILTPVGAGITLEAMLVTLGLLAAFAWAGRDIPPRPYLYVLDEPGILDKGTRDALERLLIDHDRLSGERAMAAVFSSAAEEDPAKFAGDVYRQWQIGRFGKDDGALIAVFWKEKRAILHTGIGLEHALTDAKTREITSEFVEPELLRGHHQRALLLAAMQVLKALESPSLTTGAAEQTLRASGFEGSWTVPRRTTVSWAWIAWTVAGALAAAAAGLRLSSAEAHYTGEGWVKERPGLRKPRVRGFTGGGAVGDW